MTTIAELKIEIKKLKKELFDLSKVNRKGEMMEFLQSLQVMKQARDEYMARRAETLVRPIQKPKPNIPQRRPRSAPSVSIEDGKVIVSFQSDKLLTFD
jgi:hypothetical protein